MMTRDFIVMGASAGGLEAFEKFSGHYIHNVYGLTETTSPSHAVPLGGKAPVDPASGADPGPWGVPDPPGNPYQERTKGLYLGNGAVNVR